MTVTSETLKKLKLPFPESTISWRVGQRAQNTLTGQALPFIDNRVIQNLLDEAVGPSNWKNEYTEVLANGNLVAVRCKLSIYVDNAWVGKEDAAPLTVGEGAHGLELALKGVYSDAMKRAAVHWGIGRYLYDFKAPWVPLTETGRLVEPPALPAHMLPEGAVVRESRKEGSPAAQTSASASGEKAGTTSSSPQGERPAQPASQPAAVAESAAASSQEAAKPLEPTKEAGAPQKIPAGIPPEEVSQVEDLLRKLKKNVTATMIRGYVEGPKGKEKLGVLARTYVLEQLAVHEKAAKAVAA